MVIVYLAFKLKFQNRTAVSISCSASSCIFIELSRVQSGSILLGVSDGSERTMLSMNKKLLGPFTARVSRWWSFGSEHLIINTLG